MATACPAASIQAALIAFDDSLGVCLASSRTGIASDVTSILGAVRFELAEALVWRQTNMTGADAAAVAWDHELDRVANAAAAVEQARVLRTLHGDAWKRRLPETARRLGSLIWLDVIDNEDDPVALAKALDRHYGSAVAA